MASENETVDDIVKEKRDTADEAELKGKNTFLFDLAKMLREEANRIEAASKRECEATREKSSQVGNAAKMREAVETISKCDISKEEDCYTLYRVCEAALAAPPRNCDMFENTKKAYSRFRKFCRGHFCVDCQYRKCKKSSICFGVWLLDDWLDNDRELVNRK